MTPRPPQSEELEQRIRDAFYIEPLIKESNVEAITHTNLNRFIAFVKAERTAAVRDFGEKVKAAIPSFATLTTYNDKALRLTDEKMKEVIDRLIREADL